MAEAAGQWNLMESTAVKCTETILKKINTFNTQKDNTMSNEFEKGKIFSYPQSIAYAEKAVVSKHIIKKETGNISLFAFDKGEGLSEHTAPFDAVVQIVDGRADVIIDGASNVLEAGETIIMPANIPHALNAVEQFKMVLTMIKSK
jgi:quercetin dioxygenase-like cupin family protein